MQVPCRAPEPRADGRSSSRADGAFSVGAEICHRAANVKARLAVSP